MNGKFCASYTWLFLDIIMWDIKQNKAEIYNGFIIKEMAYLIN